MFTKEYDKETIDRPYHIHWHGKFLRSYVSLEDVLRAEKFFNSFLVAIKYIKYKG